MTLGELNNLSVEAAKHEFSKCCGSILWVDRIVEKRPYANEAELYAAATDVWFSCSRIDWQEAFSYHIKIGDLNNLEGKVFATNQLAGEEHAIWSSAPKEALEKLLLINLKYEKKFGYIFVVFALGKSVEEILEIAELRLRNNPYDEIKIAASEQNRITKSRLKKLL